MAEPNKGMVASTHGMPIACCLLACKTFVVLVSHVGLGAWPDAKLWGAVQVCALCYFELAT